MQEANHKTNHLSRNNRRRQNSQSLPSIPDKRYFTIGEVGILCCVKPHVLRYWEEEFPQLSPVKRRGNRRYYQYKDVVLVRQIRQLLYENGFTIQGARSQLSGVPVETSESSKTEQTDSVLKKMIEDLEDVLKQLKNEILGAV
jgi:DNA-binding transcriptional MerR regulator